MDDLALIQSGLSTLAFILALAVASGLLFTLLSLPHRRPDARLFMIYSTLLGGWAGVSLAATLPQAQMGVPDTILTQLQASFYGAMVAAFFIYALRVSRAGENARRMLTWAAVGLLAVGLLVIWAGGLYNNTTLTSFGHILQIVCISMTVVAVFLISNVPTDEARALRLPVFVHLLGIIAITLPPIGILLLSVAAAWIGRTLMHFQWFKQLDDLSAELRTASRDLFQTSNEVSQLRSRNEELLSDFQSASAYKSDFMTNMSHKLRTPLNSIAGYTELLQSGMYGELSEKQADRINKIARNGQMLLELINDMLDLSRLEAGRMELQRIMFRPVDMIEHVVREAESASKAKGLALETVIAPDVQPLYADEKRITQVINQLVQNAIKFTEQGSVSVALQNVQVNDGRTEDFKLPTIGWLSDGLWVMITVRDTGIGITPESQGKIFDEFFQVNETGGEFSGTGLGLAICKRLVQLHDGVIWVNSTSGVGSVFYVALPAQRENVRGRQNRNAA